MIAAEFTSEAIMQFDAEAIAESEPLEPVTAVLDPPPQSSEVDDNGAAPSSAAEALASLLPKK